MSRMTITVTLHGVADHNGGQMAMHHDSAHRTARRNADIRIAGQTPKVSLATDSRQSAVKRPPPPPEAATPRRPRRKP